MQLNNLKNTQKKSKKMLDSMEDPYPILVKTMKSMLK